jgi:hypothetical protein
MRSTHGEYDVVDLHARPPKPRTHARKKHVPDNTSSESNERAGLQRMMRKKVSMNGIVVMVSVKQHVSPSPMALQVGESLPPSSLLDCKSLPSTS